MAFTLVEAAQDRWRAVNAPHLVALVRAGARFANRHLVERPDESGSEAQQRDTQSTGLDNFPARVVQALRLLPGRYRFVSGYTAFEFTVTAAGTIDYDSALTFLSGRGTTTLTVAEP
jgi:hypothetical protein